MGPKYTYGIPTDNEFEEVAGSGDFVLESSNSGIV